MKPMHKLSLSMLACVAATACGSIPKKTFVFDAIDLQEGARPCLIVVDDAWVEAADKNQVVNFPSDNTLPVTIEFRSSEVEITVAPLRVSGDQISSMPRSRMEAIQSSDFKADEPRRLRLTDPDKQLFILQPK